MLSVASAGHLINMERPVEFHAAVFKFIDAQAQ